MTKRRGFTILELLVVIGVISILITIVASAATSSMRAAREKRAATMRAALQEAINNYQAQDPQGRWPSPIQTLAESGKSGKLSESESQRVFQIIVQKSTDRGGMKLVDPHGLYVAPSGTQDGRSNGMPFSEARQGDAHRQKLAVSRMAFGYQNSKTGRFHRYNVVYNAIVNTVEVSMCCQHCLNDNGSCHDGNCRYCHNGK